MPVCFSLTRKDELEATNLITVDEEICAHLGVKPDPVKWVCNWHDTIGLLLALGKTFEEIRIDYANEPLALKVIDFLDENFIADCWRELRPLTRKPS